MVQSPHDFAVRQTGIFVEIDDGGLGIGAKLTGCRSQGIGSLQGMSALDAALAAPAFADMHVELSLDR